MRKTFATFVAGIALSAAALLLTGMTYAPAHEAAMSVSLGARPPTQTLMVEALNGAPGAAGNITTATGADVDSTAVTAGSCLLIQCTTDTYVLPGTVVTASSTTRGIVILADERFQMCLKASQTQFSTLARATAGTCGYWVMQ